MWYKNAVQRTQRRLTTTCRLSRLSDSRRQPWTYWKRWLSDSFELFTPPSNSCLATVAWEWPARYCFWSTLFWCLLSLRCYEKTVSDIVVKLIELTDSGCPMMPSNLPGGSTVQWGTGRGLLWLFTVVSSLLSCAELNVPVWCILDMLTCMQGVKKDAF